MKRLYKIIITIFGVILIFGTLILFLLNDCLELIVLSISFNMVGLTLLFFVGLTPSKIKKNNNKEADKYKKLLKDRIQEVDFFEYQMVQNEIQLNANSHYTMLSIFFAASLALLGFTLSSEIIKNELVILSAFGSLFPVCC